jgi:hypothetical protein
MSTKGFTGAAGTGKTHNLFSELEKVLAANPLEPDQRVLALTFMHGSRRRLAERLAKSSARRVCECMTLDRFAWGICRRWRTRLRVLGGLLPLDFETADFDATCEAAGKLLACPEVAAWIAVRYPVIVVDEFQDCSAVRLALAQHLHGRVKLLIAADDFQNLSMTVESPAVTWLHGLGIAQHLTHNFRTQECDLLAAALALRKGEALKEGLTKKFRLISAPSPAVAAAFISVTAAGSDPASVVLLSPARPESSAWVRTVVEFVGTKKYGKNKDVGPVPFAWEKSADSFAAATVASLGVADGDAPVAAAQIAALPKSPVANALKRWTEHQRRVQGRTEFPAGEVRTQIKRAAQQVRSLGTPPQATRRAMTIHQAKNREFRLVIVLWPFEVKADVMSARRLLYNAITRARSRAIVIVHDPKKSRLSAPPFAYPAAVPAAVVA